MLRPVRLSHFSNERRDLIWTNHLGGGYQGDTEKSGQFFPAQGYPGRDWECCVKTNDIWGCRSKSARILVGVLIDTPNQGENHLLSIDLDSKVDGPVVEVDQLQPVGKCREGNGESIYGADPIPLWSRIRLLKFHQKGQHQKAHAYACQMLELDYGCR